MMRRAVVASAVLVALAGCSEGTGREFARYYDPEGFFTTNLPAANLISVAPVQAPVEGAPAFLTGVVSSPPEPSPSPQAGIGGGFAATQTEPPDQTVYQAFAVSTTTFEDLDQMGLFYLTADPGIDVRLDEPVMIDVHAGRLVVADARQEGQVTAGVALAITLGRGGTGYLLFAIFPPGRWDAERADFLRILDSFRTTVPPGIGTIPVTAQGA